MSEMLEVTDDTVRLCAWEFGRGHFTGQPYARCTQCGTVSVYWEDVEELEQVCEVDA